MRSPASITDGFKHMKWSADREANKILVEGIARGEYDLSLQPKQLCDMHPTFKLHKLDAFRAQVNKLRTPQGKALVEAGKCD